MFSCKYIFSLNCWTYQLQTLLLHSSHDVVDTGHSYNLDTKVKVKGQIMNFLVNASPPKLLDLATSNFAGA